MCPPYTQDVYWTYIRRPGRLLNVLCTFNLRRVFTGSFDWFQKQSFVDIFQNRRSWKFRNIHRKIQVLESLFNKVAGHKTWEYCEIFKKSFFIEHLWWPLLRFQASFFFLYLWKHKKTKGYLMPSSRIENEHWSEISEL